MKLKVIFFSCAFALSANAQNVNIPDNNFKNALLAHGSSINGNIGGYEMSNIDINNDNEIQLSEAAAYNGLINVSNQNISDLTGIEAFTSLRSLFCNENSLSTLDISQNTALESLSCRQNNLTSLDVSQNTALVILNCGRNSLTSLDVSQNTNLTDLYFGRNSLTNIDLSQNTALKRLDCLYNNLTSLDVSQCLNLKRLTCGLNNITSLDLSHNTNLQYVSSSFNYSLSSLDLGQNTSLTQLHCIYNSLPYLDVTQNISLVELLCYNNALTSLDLSQNTSLSKLTCFNNSLNSLDLSQNTQLISLKCQNNSLKSLNLANGNNDSLNTVTAIGNPDLSCIQHDANFDPSSNTSWTKDTIATWNDNCGCLVTSSTDVKKHCSTNGYTWIDGNTYTQNTTGVQHTLVNASGCDSIVTLNLAFIQPPTVSIEYSNYELVATGANSFEWYLNGNLIPNENNNTLSLQNTGDYFAIGSFSESCSDTSNVISIDQLDVIENNATHFRIYPNPTNGIVTIQSEAEINNIELINNLGQKVAQFNQKNFDISEIKNGVYFVKVTTKLGDTIMKKLIKK